MKSFIARHLRMMAIVPALVLSLGIGASAVLAPQTAYAATCDTDAMTIAGGAECSKTDEQSRNLFGDDESIFKKVTNVLLFVIGAIAVIMLIIGGIRYVVSAGNQEAVTGAKNTIMYAVVGIIVALLAYAVVNFVVDSFIAS